MIGARIKKWTSMLLAVLMLVSILPVSALAEGTCIHTHTDECYTQTLICEQTEHTHASACYELICTEEHTHEASCYSDKLVCDIPEHTHTAACYEKTLSCKHVCGAECGVTEPVPVFAAIRLNLDGKADQNDIDKVPDFYTPKDLDQDQTASLFTFKTAATDADNYRVYGAWDEGTPGFYACSKNGKNVETEPAKEKKDRALYETQPMPDASSTVLSAEPTSEPTAAPVCDCGAAEGEAHAETCPLYTAPEAEPEATPEPQDDATPETPLSEAGAAFVDAVDALDTDAMLAAARAYKDAEAVEAADPENAELAAALTAAQEALDTATAPINAAMALYEDVPVAELSDERVQTAMIKLAEIVNSVQAALDTAPAAFTSTGAVEVNNLTVTVDGTAYVVGDTANVTTTNTFTVSCLLGGNVSWINRTIAIDIPLGWRLISGPGISSVGNGTYTAQAYTPDEAIAFSTAPTWTPDARIRMTENFDLWPKSGTLTYPINDGTLDYKLVLTLQAEDALYNYSGAHTLADLSATMTGVDDADPSVTSTDTKAVGAKLSGCTVETARSFVNSNMYANSANTDAASAIYDQTQQVRVGALEDCLYNGTDTNPYKYAYNTYFDYVYPTGATVTLGSSGWTMSAPVDDTVAGTSTVRVSTKSKLTYRATDARVDSRTFCIINLTYPENAGFVAGQVYHTTVQDMTWQTAKVNADGTVDWVTHVANNDPQTSTTVVAKKPFQPPYYQQSLNSEKKNGYDGVLQTFLNVCTRLCGTAAGVGTDPEGSISGPSATPVRFSYKGDALDNTTYLQIAVSSTVTNNTGNLQTIHIEYTDGTSLEWNQGDGALPGAINYHNVAGGRGTSWQYTAPEGKAIKNAYVQYSKVTEDEAASSTWGRCLAQGRPVLEQYTGTYSHHTFYTQQWNGSAWVTVSTSDIAGEEEGNYQSYTNHGGFRWERPAEFLLVETGTNSSPVNSYDGIGTTGSENSLVPAQPGIVKLSTYTFSNSTGSYAEKPVRVDFDLNTNTHKDNVTEINFPIPYNADANESVKFVTRLEWQYTDGNTGSWDAASVAPMPFTLYHDNTNSYGAFVADDGKYLADFTVYLSDWNASTHVATAQIIGHPTEDDRFNVYSAHTITVTTVGEEDTQISTATAGFGYRSSTAQFVNPMGKNLELNAGSAGALQVTLQAGARWNNGQAGINEENSQWYGHVSFAFILPNDVTPNDEAQVTWPRNTMGYGSTTATLKSSHTASAAEKAAANMSGLDATVYVYDFDRQEITWIGRYPDRASTQPQVVLPIEVDPLSPDYTFTYAQIFYAGSNRGPELNDSAAIPLNGPTTVRTTYTDGDAEAATSTVVQTGANAITDLGVTANAVRGDAATLIIHKDPALVVQEHIAASDGDYKVFNADSPEYATFAPNEEGTILLNIFNTVNDEAIVVKDGYVFLPIPKASGNSALVTDHAFDFVLNGTPTITEGFENFESVEITYITSDTEPTANNAPALFASGTPTYSASMAASVKMVAFKLNDLRTGTGMEVKIPVKAPSVVSNEMIYDQAQARSVYLYTPTAWTTFSSGERFGYLRAGYINPQWTVSFDSNGGTPVDDQLVMDGQKATDATTTCNGYTFDGWYTANDFRTLYDFDTPVTADITLYAKWTEEGNVVIHYTTDVGGSLSRTEESLPPATGTAVGSTVTVSDGYTFEGWFDEDDALVGAAESLVPARINGLNVAATYHAKITPNTDTPYRVEYYQENQTVGSYTIVAADTVNATGTTDTAPTVVQKTYDGFTYERRTYEDSAHTTAQAAELTIAGDGSLVVKLYYTRNTCKVTFQNAAHGGVLVDDGGTEIDTATYEQIKKAGQTADGGISVQRSEGYVQIGWSYVMTVNGEQRTGTVADYTTLTLLGDTEFTPNIAKPPYVVINSTGNGYVAASEKGSTSVPTTVTDATAKREWETVGDVATNVALAFKAKEHYTVSSITLQMPQSEVIDPTTVIPIPLTNGTNIGALANGMLKDDGSAVLQMAADGKSGAIIIQGMDDNCVFTVNYAPINFTASFDTDGGTPDPADQTVQEGALVTEPGAPAKDGYTFGGWQYQDGEEWKDYDFSTEMTGDILLKAKWTENSVTIVYRSADTEMGTVSVGSETLLIHTGTAQGSEAEPKTGYRFVNWTDATGAEVSTAADFVPAKVDGKNVAATYTAHFAAIDYQLTVHYVYEDGTEAKPDVVRTVPYNSAYNVASPVIEGYKADKKTVSGTMEARNMEFTVTYYAPEPVGAAFDGTKTLTEGEQNRTMTAGQFRFRIVAAAGNDDTGYTGFTAGDADVDADGQFSFGEIQFVKAGVYTFTVSEYDDGTAGFTYDAKPVTVVFDVKWDENSNTLSIDSTTYTKDGQGQDGVSFANTYTAPEALDIPIAGTKTLTGGGKTAADITADQFTFTVTEGANNPIDGVSGLPAAAVGTEAATGALDFGEWTFSKVGTYTFTIAEDDIADTHYTKGDDVTVTVVIELDEETNTLTQDVTYSSGDTLTFANVYDPDDATAAVSVTKTVTGTLPTAASFEFTIAQTAGVEENVVMPTTKKITTAAITTGNATAVSFDDITFTAPGEYKFSVTETNSAIPHLNYAAAQTVTVNVVDNEGTLEATATPNNGALTFTNVYAPVAATITDAELNIIKTVTGTMPEAHSFVFTIAQTGGETANVTMPTNVTATTAELATGSAAAVGFGDVTFKAAGTYTFSITETDSGIPGMTYAAPQTVTVKVVDTNGVLSAAIVTSATDDTPASGRLTFTNEYVPDAAALAAPTVTKGFGAVTPTANETFTFTMTRNADTYPMPEGSVGGVKTITSTGSTLNAQFGSVSFTAAGEYTYTIKETQGTLPGYTFDTTEYIWTVNVVDNNGTLNATGTLAKTTSAGTEETTAAFTNPYNPTANPYVIPTVTKEISGGHTLPANKDFTFVLTQTDGNEARMPEGSTGKTKTITINGAGTGVFGQISFGGTTVGNTYTYSITETNGSDHGYTYNPDKVSYLITITTTDEVIDGNAQIVVHPTVKKLVDGADVGAADTVRFTNAYAPDAASYTPGATKVVDGEERPAGGEKSFDFLLTPESDTTPMPDGLETDGTKKISITGSSTATPGSFGAIRYTKAGEYVYAITEKTPAAADPAYAYDNTSYTLTVTVTDTDGVLAAAGVIKKTGETAAVNAAAFTNTYTPAETTASLSAIKTIGGQSLPTEKAFTFTVALAGGTAADVVMPDPATVTTPAITEGSTTAQVFGAITFKAAGFYTFTVTETASGVTGMQDAAPQTVYVRVTDNAGTLSAAIVTSETDNTEKSGTLTFTNTYTPRSVVAADPPVQKIISGDTPATAETFTFQMQATSYTAPQGSTHTMTPAQMPMPTGSVNGVKEITIEGAGTEDFGPYTYTMAGTYVYTITEPEGTNADYGYDGSAYTLTDVVTDDNGELSYERTITKPGVAPNPTTAVFTNTYTQPTGTLTVSKTVTGGGNANALFTFRFTFSADGAYPYTGSRTGTIGNGGSLQLKHGESVTITIPRNVTYTVIEDAVLNYDPTPADRTFRGTISETASRAAFTNRYDEPYIPTLTGNLTVRKTVTGDLGNRNKDFAFTIVFNDAGSYVFTGSESGVISSGDTILLRHGEYITIVNLPAGISYSVTESGNSGYHVYTSGDVGVISANHTSIAAFTNSKSKVPPTGDDDTALKGVLLMMASVAIALGLLIADQRFKRRKRKAKSAR